jgi:Novel STAND NTPase 1/WD domain, G-beta repeat
VTDAGSRAVQSPFKGLGYYGERDAPFFFGRERETSIITANLVASPLTLVYGASGVGKSSLLRAGVARSLRERAAEDAAHLGAPGSVVVVFPADEDTDTPRRDTWRDEPIAALAAGIARAADDLGVDIERPSGSLRLADLLAAWNERLNADLLLILDQFEEYFLYHGEEHGDGSLLVELPRALLAGDVQANVLLSIREDAYAKLDAFKGRIPFLYDNYLRVDHLDRAAGRLAILRPVEQYNRLVAGSEEAVAVEPALVDAVLEQVQTGNVVIGQTGRGGVDASGGTDRVETPFLQLVLERIWNEEAAAGSRALQRATLDRLGGAGRIVRTHLDAAMEALSDDEKGIAAQAFRQLVTPSGTKIAHLPSDLAALEDIPEVPLVGILERLAAARIVRPIAPPPGQSEPRYEIYHDVLAPAVLDWRARYREQARERRWRRRSIKAAVILAAVVAVGIGTIVLVLEHNAAQKRADERRALVSDARDAFGFAGIFVGHRGAVRSAEFSPDSMRILTAGEDGTIRIWKTSTATDPNGGTMLLKLKLKEGALASAHFGPRPGLVVTAGEDGASVWSLRTRQRVARLPVGPAEDAVVNARGTIVAVAGDDGIGRLVAWPSLRTIAQLADPQQSEIRSIEFSPDGQLLATASDDGFVRIWGLDGRQTRLPLTGSTDEGTAYDASFDPRGRFLVTAGQDGFARVWDLQGSGKRPLAIFRDPDEEGSIDTARFSADGRFVVTGEADTWVWDWRRQQLALKFLEDHGGVNRASFGRHDSVVVSADGDGAVRLWSVALPDLKVRTGRLKLGLNGATLRVPVIVQNVGNGAAPRTHGIVEAPGFPSVRFTVPALRPGVTVPIEVRLHVPAAARGRTARVSAVVNADGDVTEEATLPDAASASILVPAG